MSNSMIKSIDKERVPVIDIKKINSASNKIDIAKEWIEVGKLPI